MLVMLAARRSFRHRVGIIPQVRSRVIPKGWIGTVLARSAASLRCAPAGCVPLRGQWQSNRGSNPTLPSVVSRLRRGMNTVRVGFEPTVRFRVRSFSKAVLSTTQPPHQVTSRNKLNQGRHLHGSPLIEALRNQTIPRPSTRFHHPDPRPLIPLTQGPKDLRT